MASKYSADVELQVRESDASKERCDQTNASTNDSDWDVSDNKTNALIDNWDAPDNQENPRNWSACERYAIIIAFTFRKQR
jgi:hypothetical protein